MSVAGELEDIIESIWYRFVECRAFFPYTDVRSAGQDLMRTGPWYEDLGFPVILQFGKPLTQEDIERRNSVADFLNQSFVAMLYSTLEKSRIVGNNVRIDPDLAGCDEMDILRRLRNKIGHAGGEYDPADPKARKLYERIVKHFGLELSLDSCSARRFPLPIDEVLRPLMDGCLHYAISLLGLQDGTAVTPGSS